MFPEKIQVFEKFWPDPDKFIIAEKLRSLMEKRIKNSTIREIINRIKGM